MGYKSENGKSLLSLLVTLALTSILLMLAVGFVQSVLGWNSQLMGRVYLQDSLTEVEDFFRKEFGGLRFSPLCPLRLPAPNEFVLGDGIDSLYRDRLKYGLIVAKSNINASTIVDLKNLRGSGATRYSPALVKNVSGIVQGQDVLMAHALLPTTLNVREGLIEGELTPDLVGVRSSKFYITDCTNSVVLEADRVRDHYVLKHDDFRKVALFIDSDRLHVYQVKEFFIYLQLQRGAPSLVVDGLDGQAFLRIPHIIGLSFKVNNSLLHMQVVAGNPSLKEISDLKLDAGSGEIIYRNAASIEWRNIIVELESR